MVDVTVPIKFDDDPDPETETQQPVQSDEVTAFDKLMAVGLDQTPARTAKDHKNLLPDIDHDGYAAAAETAAALPGSSVDDVYDDHAPYREVKSKNAFDKVMDESPGTAIFFSKQKNVKVAGDAAEELGAVEALLKYGGRSIARGGIRMGQMFQQYGAEQAAEQKTDAQRSFMEILRDENPYQAQNPFGVYDPFDLLLASERFATSRLLSPEDASKAAAYRLRRVKDLTKLSQDEYGIAQKDHQDAIMEAGKNGLMPAIEEAVKNPGKTLALGAEIAGEFAPQLLMAGATTYAAGPAAGSAMMGFQSGLVERYASPAEYFGKKGYDLSKPEDIQKIVSDPKIMSEAQTYGFSRAMIIGTIDAISGGIASQYYGGPLRTFLVNAIAQPALGGGGEAAAQLKTEGKVENWGEVVLEAIGEFAMMPAEVTVLGGGAIRDARRAQKAKRQGERLKEAMDVSRKTAVAKRAPDIAAEHRADIFADNGIDKVTIDVDRFVAYMQDSADPDFASRLGLTEEGLNDAIELGGEIVIDADGLSYLAGQENFDAIADYVRFDESDMSAAEAAEFEQSFFREEFEKLENQIASLDFTERNEVEAIRQEVEAQVKAAGRSDNEAQFIGMLLGERYATRGERAGMSPLEMWRRDNVRVAGPGQQLPGLDEVDLAIDRLQGGVSADQFLRLRKTPMINALIDQGGIDPTSRLAQELRARDINEKTMRRLFVEGGLGEADNLVQSDFDFLDAEAVGDTGYIDQSLLIDAIEADYRGTPYRSLDEQDQIAQYEGGLSEIQNAINEAGLTAESSKEEIRAAVNAAIDNARQFEQRNPDAHQDRISTRQPTTKFATEDPLTEDLVIDLDTMKRDRNTFEYNMREIVGRYRNVRATDAKLAADELADKFVDHAVSNLLYLFDSVPADTRERSRLWYDGARALTDRWSAKYNVPDRVVAGVLASLSPQKDWFMNVSLGERVLDIMTNQQNHRFDDNMLETASGSVLAVKKGGKPIAGQINPAYKKAFKEIQGKTLAEVVDPKHKAIWLRIYDEAYHDRRHRIVTPEGEFSDWAKGTVENPIDDMGALTPVGEDKKTGWGSFSEITKAVNVILDSSPDNISIEMGDKHKVRNFFNNILSPNAPQQDVTIDTHAVAAALLQPLSGGSREVHHNFGSAPMTGKKPPNWMAAKNYKGNGVEGLYGLYADAYRAAAKKRGVSARQMQSITWEAARGLFTPVYKQDAANVEAIERIWDNYRNGKSTIQKTRSEVLEHAGGINPPEWEGRDSGVTGGEFNSSYSEELSESGIPRFEPGLSPSGTGSQFTGILAGQGLEPSGVFLQPTRGAIELRAHETIIRLGKNADASTFLHENGHLFLEQLKSDAREFGTEQLVEDWNTTRNWWASNSESIRREAIQYARKKGDEKSASVLDKMGQSAIRAYVRTGDLTGGTEYAGKGAATAPLQYLTEAMHEQYARGFEDYLRTGQAPSVQLQGAFNRFRGWLVSIYNAIRRRLGRDILDIQYSREVAQTVDRLLASDTDIELVREQYDLKALYDSAEEAGMTPKQFERYQLQVARAVDQAKTRQLKKHLNEVERETKEFWKSEGKEIAGGIGATLAQEPAYKALYTLTQKSLADGTPLPEGFAVDRLDRKAVIKVLQSKDSLARLPKVKGKAIYTTKTKESGIHPDVAANMFGFRDGMEMLQAMASARPFDEVVQERVDAQLKEKYGDMRNDGSAVEEAIESVHIDETAEVLTAELNALRDSKDKMKPAFVRQWAIEKLGGRKVSEMRPNEFLQAEKRHAKEAGKLLRQGDRLGAQRAKFKQLMNFYMAKEAIKARNEITAGRKYFSRFTAKRRNYKTLAAEYVDQIKNILSNYQFGPRLSKDIKAWLDFAKAAEENDGSIFDIPQEILDADGQTNYQDLTLDEFRTLRDAIKSIEAQGRLARTVEVEGQRVYLDDAETEITDRLEDRPMTKRGIGKQGGYPGTLKGRWNEWKDKRMSGLASLDASLAKIEFLAFQVDGEKNGPFHKFFFQTFADAEFARNDMVAKVGKPIMDAIQNMPRKMQRELGVKVYVPELNRYFARSEIIMMALNTGNESNRDKLIRGSTRDVYDSAALTEEILDKILDNLVLEEWQFVQTVWDSFQSMYPEVEAVFRKENGRSPETIDAVPFEREFGGQTYEFRGGYFPMMYDQSRSAQGADIKEKTALEALQAQGNQAGVFSGMTKERNETFAVPVSLDIAAIPQHLERNAHYITHYEAVRTTSKLLRRENLNKAIVQTMGDEYFQVLNNWMGAIAANQAPQVRSEFWSKVIKFFRTNSTIAIMGLSYTTGVAQTLGLFTSIDALSQQPDGKYNALVGQKWMVAGMWNYLKNPTQSIRMIKEMSGEMRHRIYNTDRDVSYAMRQFERTASGQSMMKGKYKEFQRFSMMAIAGVQVLMVDYPTWMGAYNKALAEGKAPGDAVNYADSIIRTSQTAGGLKDMSAAQMNETMAPFMMFYSFFNVLYNIERQIAGGLKENGIKDVPQAAARVFMVMALPTIIENIYKDKWPDEDEDEDGVISGWDYAKWTAMKTAYFGLSSVPLLRDIAGGAFTGFGYSISPMDSLGDSTVKTIQSISKMFDEDETEMTESIAKSIIGTIGFGIGFPVVQLNREVKTYFAMEEGEDVDWYDWLVGYREPASSAFKD